MKKKMKGSSLIFALILSFILSLIMITITEYVIYKNKKTKIIKTKIDISILRKRLLKKEKYQKEIKGYFNFNKLDKELLIYLNSGNESIGGYHIESILIDNEKFSPPLSRSKNYEKIVVIYLKEILGQKIRVKENIRFILNGDIYLPYSYNISFIEEDI